VNAALKLAAYLCYVLHIYITTCKQGTKPLQQQANKQQHVAWITCEPALWHLPAPVVQPNRALRKLRGGQQTGSSVQAQNSGQSGVYCFQVVDCVQVLGRNRVGVPKKTVA
jgi:hypothetical protein